MNASEPNSAKLPIHFVVQEIHDKPVIDADHPDAAGNKYGFEGGSVVKVNGAYHLFVAEMTGDPFWQQMRLAHWRSPDAVNWKRQSTIKATSGQPIRETKMPYESVWATMPVYNEDEGQWDLYWVAYDLGATGGRIWRSLSTVKGRDGIAGPYKDVGIILQPDQESQKWEGTQGTDSFFPFKVNNRWLAFYGSHGGCPGWVVGLCEAPALAGPWKRLPEGNPLPVEPVFIENPIVTKVGDLYVAVYDSDRVNPPAATYYKEAHHVGFMTSTDGVHWTGGGRITVQPDGPANWSVDIRTPLGLVPEGNNVFTLLYTAEAKGRKYWPVGMVRVKMVRD